MILIIGAGLSGLLTAYRLKREGIPFKILEARNRVGGRISTVYDRNNTPVEMGATWFGSQHKRLMSLLEELGIECFQQHVDNPVFFQASSTSEIQSLLIPNQALSYRISGGTSSIINALLGNLDPKCVLLNQSVTEIRFYDKSVQVLAKETFEAYSVVLAIPPKLWAKNIVFQPPLVDDLINVAEQTHTWMEDSIKVALTYERPFWQEESLPATFFSNSGPITELYDHCTQDGSKYALCGFIHASFRELSHSERRDSVISQIRKIFGDKAETFVSYKECVWSEDENTFYQSDNYLNPHQNNGHPIFSRSFINDRLFISSSESASEFPGYMEGAVCSANLTVKKIVRALRGL